MKIAAASGRNAVIERASASVGADGSSLAANAPRVTSQAWASPVTMTRVQDAASADYYPLDSCSVHGKILFATDSTSHNRHDKIWVSDGVPDENGDYTFTKVADIADEPFASLDNSGFMSAKCLDNGDWILVAYSNGWTYKSTDAGTSWARVDTVKRYVPQFGWSGVDGAHLVVADYIDVDATRKIHFSHDYGNTWESFDTFEVAELTPDVPASNYHFHDCVWEPGSDHTAAWISRGDGSNAITFRVYYSSGAWHLDTTDLYYHDGIAVTGVTLPSGDVVTITVAAHNLNTGDKARFYDVGGTTELNYHQYTVTVVNTTSFTLQSTDGDNFTAWTSGGVARQVPVGLPNEIGLGQPCGAVARGDYIYWGTEAQEGPTLVRHDPSTGEIAKVVNMPRQGATAYYDIARSSHLVFGLRLVGGLYYMGLMTDTTHMTTMLLVSPDMEHWACIARNTVAGSGSFFGYQTFCELNGRVFVGTCSDLTTRWCEVFDPPACQVVEGVTTQEGEANLMSPAAGHTNDNATFSTASSNYSDSSGNVSMTRSDEEAWTGTHSLKVVNNANYTSVVVIDGPYLVATLGEALPATGKVIIARCKMWIPPAYRHGPLEARLMFDYGGAGNAKTSKQYGNPHYTPIRFLLNPETGWAEWTTAVTVISDFAAGDDARFALYMRMVQPSFYGYLDAVEFFVRDGRRQEYYKPFDVGVASDEYQVVPTVGCGDEWTATLLWRPTILSTKQIISGLLPVCRVACANGNFWTLDWVATAGADRGKFRITRTVGGSSETAVLSTGQYELLHDDVLAIVLGTDSADSKIQAIIYAATGSETIQDDDTSMSQPAHILLGDILDATNGGVGVFNAAQVFDEELSASDIAINLKNLQPRIKARYKLGVLMPI